MTSALLFFFATVTGMRASSRVNSRFPFSSRLKRSTSVPAGSALGAVRGIFLQAVAGARSNRAGRARRARIMEPPVPRVAEERVLLREAKFPSGHGCEIRLDLPLPGRFRGLGAFGPHERPAEGEDGFAALLEGLRVGRVHLRL